MVIGNKSTISKPTPSRSTQARSNQARATPSKNTPIKSTPIKSTPIKSTPVKRKQEFSGGSTKKIKLDVFNLEIKAKGIQENEIPAIVLSMGGGVTGQLGLGADITERKRPTEIPNLKDIIAIRAGGMHSVCLSKNGIVYTFGCEEEGALGRQIVEDEEATFPAEITLPNNIVVKDITAGDNHSSVLTEDGQVYIWGNFRDESGMIGLLKPFEKLIYPTLMPVGNHKIMKVCSGYNHVAMLTEAGEVLTFGCSEFGQLGRVSSNNLMRGGRTGLAPLLSLGPVRVQRNTRFVDVWAGSYCTVARATDGTIYGCGLNNYGQLGVKGEMILLMMTNLVGFSQVDKAWTNFVFGDHHMIGLTESGRLFAVGRGECGSLGQGDNQHRDEVIEVMLPQSGVASIAACNRSSFALMKDGNAFSWGMGCNNQLGHGTDDDDINVPTKIGGKQLVDKRLVEISPGYQHVLFRAVPVMTDKQIGVSVVEAAVLPVIETINEVEEPIAQDDLVENSELINVCHTQETIEQPQDKDIQELTDVVKDVTTEIESSEQVKESVEHIQQPNEENLQIIEKDEVVSVPTQELMFVSEGPLSQSDVDVAIQQENAQPIVEESCEPSLEEKEPISYQEEIMEVDVSEDRGAIIEDTQLAENMDIDAKKPEINNNSNNSSCDGNTTEQMDGDN